MRIKPFALILALLAVCSLFSCNSTPNYANHISAASLGDAVQTAIGADEKYMTAQASDYSFYFNDDPALSLVNDSTMRFHPEVTNVNEFGIFRAADEQSAKQVEQMIAAYLEMQTADLRSFAQNYSPEDLSKIDAARVERVGVYVVYLILSPQDASAAMDAIRKELTE